MLKVHGIRFRTNNNEYFLHLDKQQLTGWYGWLFVLMNKAWVSYRESTKEDLIKILKNTKQEWIEI